MKISKRIISLFVLIMILTVALCDNVVVNAENTSYGVVLQTQSGVLEETESKTFAFCVEEESLINVIFIGKNDLGKTSGAFDVIIKNSSDSVLLSKSVSIYEYNYILDIKLEKGNYSIELVGDDYSKSDYCFYIKSEICLLNRQSGEIKSAENKTFSFDLETSMEVHLNFIDNSYGSFLTEVFNSNNVLVFSKEFEVEYDFKTISIALPPDSYKVKLYENEGYKCDYSFYISALPINYEVEFPTVNTYYPIKIKHKVLSKGKSISYSFSLSQKSKFTILFYDADGDYQMYIKKGNSIVEKYRGELYEQKRTHNIFLNKGNYKLVIKADSKFSYYFKGKATKANANDKNNFKITSISKKNHVMKVKDELQLKVKANFYDPYITWKTGNKKIVSVDSDGYVCSKNLGKTKVTAKLYKSNTISFNVVVKRYNKVIDISPGKKLSIKKFFKYCGTKGKFSTSNKKVLVIKNKKIIAKKEGVATVSYKKSGIKYTLKVRVKYKKPTAVMYISNYDTRNNIIEAYVFNSGKGVMKLYSKDAKIIDWDYKSYDRDLHLVNNQSSVTITPKKGKYVRFKVEGELTYPGTRRKDIQCNMNYDGKMYWIAISNSGYIWRNGSFVEMPED